MPLCPDAKSTICRALCAFAQAILLAGCLPSHNILFAQDQPLSQMVHTSWTAKEGAPQDIKAIVQAKDGTLWIGTAAGLFNFDGLEFTPFRSPSGEPPLPSPSVKSLLVARDGALWVGMRLAGAARIFNGHVTIYNNYPDGRPIYEILNLRESPDGSIVGILDNGNFVTLLPDGKVRIEASPSGIEQRAVRGFFFDSSGSLWENDNKYLYKRQAGQAGFRKTAVSAFLPMDFLEMADGTIWMTDYDFDVSKGRRQHFDRNGNVLSSVYDSPMAYTALGMPDGSVIMSMLNKGLQRIRWADHVAFSKRPTGKRAENFRRTDGLSSDYVQTVMRDKDGNIWSGGLKGIDRFKNAHLEKFLAPSPHEDSLSPDWQVCTNPIGEVWIANTDKQLYKIDHGLVKTISKTQEPQKLFCGRNGDVWTVTTQGIWNVRSGKPSHVPEFPGWMSDLRAMAESKEDVFIASNIGGKQAIRMLVQGSWVQLPSDKPLPDVAQAIIRDAPGRLWIASAHNIFVLEDTHLKKVSSVPSDFGVIQEIANSSRGLLIATTNGLAYVHDERLQRLTFEDPQLVRGLTGAVEARNTDVWLNGGRGIVRIPSSEFNAAVRDQHHQIRAENVAEGDFIGPASLTVQNPSAAIDATGKLWFATINGVVSFDPEQKFVAMATPLLSITSLTADKLQLDIKGSFAPRLQTLEIHYRGVNLTSPENVVYKYRLDGVDSAWREVGHRSEAIYTQLAPGKYTFHVMASNGDGVWIAAASSQLFTVKPAFYQTWWFALLEVMTAILLLWLMLEARVRTIARALRARADERADERIRIARELHDTLLQGVQGLLMNFHVAAHKIPPDEESRKMLEKALSSADQLIVEGRNRVNSLRSEQFNDEELLHALELVGQDLDIDGCVGYKVKRFGIVNPLHQHIAAEVFYIAREALTNAFRHAQASEITLELRYGRDVFELSCRDNGRGFKPSKNDLAVKQGHWGLRGMAERVAKIGAQFECKSEPSRGTEIAVVIPCHLAYWRKSRLRSLLSRINLGRERHESATEG